jgi:hypothetical protein
MSLLQHDGFDHYGTTALQSATSVSSIQWVSSGYVLPTGTISPAVSYGKNAASLGLGLTGSTSNFDWIKKAIRPESNNTGAAFTPSKRLVLGVAVRFPLALTGQINFLRMGGVSVNIGTDWFIYVDGVQTSYQCELNIWNFVELRFDLENNKVGLYMTDQLVLEKTSTNPVLDFYEIRCQLVTGSGGGIYVHVDDLYLLDGSGTYNNDRIGKCNTLTRMPTADDTKGMTPDTGTANFSRVNTLTPDGDTSFVSSNTPGATDLYTNLTAFTTVDDAAIRAVTIAPSVRMLEPDSLSVTAVIKVGTSEAVGYRMKLKAATYTSEKHIFETSPATSLPWTPTEALNVKFGQRILAKP